MCFILCKNNIKYSYIIIISNDRTYKGNKPKLKLQKLSFELMDIYLIIKRKQMFLFLCTVNNIICFRQLWSILVFTALVLEVEDSNTVHNIIFLRKILLPDCLTPLK